MVSEMVRELVAQVTVNECGVVFGAPSVLSALCAHLGFKNPCSKGRVFLTDAKRRYLGLEVAVEAASTCPVCASFGRSACKAHR